MSRNTASFNEIVALLWRNETGDDGDSDDGQREQRDARDIEQDLRRLLLLSRDAKQRDQMVQAQAVRRVTNIAKQASSVNGWGVQRCCAAILCNLAQSERGRLSASSCDRWRCVSHRHNCPLALLLRQAVSTGPPTSCDLCLRQLSAAALLSYSVQNECQTQLDLIEALPLLLRRLHDARDDAELRVFVAATLWNLTKSPLLLLKLETVHGILRDQLMRKLTDVLWTPLESFQLSATPTGERGTSGLLDSDSADNLGVMIAASASTELSVVLHIENYVGRPRSLVDQFRAKTPLLGGRQRDPSAVVEDRSVSHFDEAGALVSRSCAVCGKKIKLRRRRKARHGGEPPAYLACARDGCEQTFHAACSRWKALSDERRAAHAHEFHCVACMVRVGGVHYCDFIADDPRHESLLTEVRFKSVGIQRFASSESDATVEYTALLDKQSKDVVAVGVKKYRIPASSQDTETFVVLVRYVRRSACPATQQQVQRNRTPSPSPPTMTASASTWSISYAREGALQLPATPGSVVFWPGPFLQDLDASLYTQRSLADLESVFLYEFQGETATDKTYSFGRATHDDAGGGVAAATATTTEATPLALWTTLYPRRGVCMKLLAEQIGHHKQLNELLGGTSNSTARGPTPGKASTGTGANKKPLRKSLLPGRKHNRVAVATTGMT